VSSLGNLTQSGVLTVGGTSSFTTSASDATITLTDSGNAMSGAITLSTTGTAGNVQLTNNVATQLAASTVNGNLTVIDRVGNLTQSGALTVTGTSSFSNQATNGLITLTNTGNALSGAITLSTTGTAGNVQLTNNVATQLAASTVNGNLTVIDRVSNLTQSGALTVSGTSNFTNQATDGLITLTDTGNALTGAITLSTTGTAGNVQLTNNVATQLAASTVNGNLTVIDSVGSLTQSGALTVSGTSSFTTSAANATITLNSANLLTGAVSLNTTGSSGNASLTNNLAGGLVLGASSIGGDLTVETTTGDLTLGGAVTAGGAVSMLSAGNLTIASGAQVTSTQTSGNSIVLSAIGNFVNNRGSDALSVAGSARWLIYSNAPTTDTFNDLNSANTAIWNATYATLPPGSVTLTGNRYVFATIDGTNPATLTFTSTNASKTYGDVANVSSNFTVSGYQPGVANAFLADTASTAYSGAPDLTSAGTAATATVAGSPYAINIAAGSLASSSGYQFTFVSSGQLTVNKRPVTATIGNESKIYGADDPSLSGIEVTLANVVNGDTVTASLASLTRIAGESVAGGPYAITAGTLNALGGADAGNYTASFSVANGPTLTITQKAMTATIGNQSKTYGADDPSLSTIPMTLAGVVNRTVATWNGNTSINDTGLVTASPASLTRNAGESVGSYAITGGTLVLGGTSAGNYSASFSVSGSPTLTVNPAALTATIGDQSKTYGADDPSPSGITPMLAGVINRTLATWNGSASINDAGLVTASLASLTRNAGENVGSYAYTAGTLNPLSGTSAGNYTASFSVANGPILTINPAPLTITASNASKTYDIVPYRGGNGVTYSGFVNGENSSVLSGTIAYGGNSQGAANAGIYTIIPSGQTSSNYAITYVNGMLAINPQPLTITANNVTQFYNNVPYTGGNGVTYAGFVSGQNASVLSGTIVYGGNSQGAVNAGTYTIIPSGQTSSNYAITYVNGTLTINPLPFTVVLDALGTAANIAGTTSPSTVMNTTVLPTSPASLLGSVTLFGDNTVLPYDSDTDASVDRRRRKRRGAAR
jgi:MBG domain (YGX type)/Repeats of unknown function (DUF5649)